MAKKHICFDWAAKKMLGDKKNFDILEGFLSELLKEDILIEGLLESESNQEDVSRKLRKLEKIPRQYKSPNKVHVLC